MSNKKKKKNKRKRFEFKIRHKFQQTFNFEVVGIQAVWPVSEFAKAMRLSRLEEIAQKDPDVLVLYGTVGDEGVTIKPNEGKEHVDKVNNN